ncbi:hypothetical protein T459_17732 [Capsicum annuum]|uniref:Ubiquitin-like protease family profile domain-containing protein n=1 Tax=Capsicum annuum TaxID=4072 RepID=A0A2G2ZCF7_CAPAN|nr:hypothetical protein T459_17732 [Capsicum annuum]
MNATLTESVQDALDTLIFGLSTPLNTNKFDVLTPNLVMESQWSLPDSQFPPDFPDAQVKELEAAKAREVKHKSPVKRDRKSQRFSGHHTSQNLDRALKMREVLMIKRIRVKTEHISTQEDYAESVVCASNKIAIRNIINGFCIPVGLPWHLVDEVYVPVNCGKEYHWVLAVIVLKERTIRVYDSLSSKKKSEPSTEIQKLAAMLPTYLSDSDFFQKTERID